MKILQGAHVVTKEYETQQHVLDCKEINMMKNKKDKLNCFQSTENMEQLICLTVLTFENTYTLFTVLSFPSPCIIRALKYSFFLLFYNISYQYLSVFVSDPGR